MAVRRSLQRPSLRAASGGSSERTSVPALWTMLTATSLLSASSLVPGSASVQLSKLLSTCVDASLRGCEEIRRVHARRLVSGHAIAVDLKDATDPKSALTEADLAAQAVILGGLQATWPGVRIVGEESEEAAPASPDVPKLREDLCAALTNEQTVQLCDVTIFVDPLDGTREFVEGLSLIHI